MPTAFKRRLPPGPRGVPLVGNAPAFLADRLAFFGRAAAEHGDVVGLRLGPYRAVLVSNPVLVHELLVTRHDRVGKGPTLRAAKVLLGEGLLTSEGEHHRRQRRLVAPAFGQRRLDGYSAGMSSLADRAVRRWRDGQTVDVAAAMRRLTLAIAAETLFGADVEDEADEVGEAVEEAIALSGGLFVPLGRLLLLLPLPGSVRLRRSRRRLDATVHRLLRQRRADPGDRGDLLSMLLAAQEPAGNGPAEGMTDEQVRDEVLTLLLAGHETTTSALTWAADLLARHPDAQERAAAEVAGVAAGASVAPEALDGLRYTRGVFAEALRLYPPSWAMTRRVLHDTTLGGLPVRRGWLVVASQWVVHRDPRWWADPHAFAPQRWVDDPFGGAPRFAYFPFGGGPRRCIGESFAWREGLTVLAAVLGHWRLEPVAGHEARPSPAMTLRPSPGPLVTVRRR